MPAVDDFLKTVLRSGVLDREQLQAALRKLPSRLRDDPEAVARHLVRGGHLSLFQAHKLLQGTPRGLRLGPYIILAPIGRGGMGTVYLARDTRDNDLLALKVLPPKKAREEERMLARFRREMEMCQLVSHPHLAQTYGVGVSDGIYYIAMEYIPGKSLRGLVMDDGPLKVAHVARLFAEAASGLEHAHRRGLIHRDLKPSNILITPNDHVKVVDLGLALMQGEDVSAREIVGGRGYVVGTMDYLAPEQAEDAAQVDARTDIYGLGCCLYFALTKRPPFPGGTTREKIQKHREEQPTPIPELNPDVPPGFIGVVRRMMAKDPDQRQASAAELREELLRWAGEEPALPMDAAEDSAYIRAVVSLETTEPALELESGADVLSLLPEDPVVEAIPVGTLVPPPRHRAPRPTPVSVPSTLSLAAEPTQQHWPAFLIAVEISALIFIAAGLAFLLYLWLH